MADRNLDHLHPDLKPLCQQWLAACQKQIVAAFVDFTWRSLDEQNKLYAIGRDANGIKIGKTVTNARGGKSKHNFTLPDGTPASKAFDFAIKRPDGTLNWDVNSPDFKTAVALGKALGLQWGGDFPGTLGDYDHFQIA